MENFPIGVIDSGIGGLSVLLEMDEKLKGCNFYYLGDNDNAPYGNKSKRELLRLALSNIYVLKSCGVRAVVVACNTLSVSLIEELEYYSGIKCFGVYPPIEQYSFDDNNVLICTPKTAEKYYKYTNLTTLAMPNLATDVELNILTPERIDLFDHFFNAFKQSKIKETFLTTNPTKFFKNKRLILGCTHYVLIKNQIFNHFQPQKILSGNQGAVKMLFNFIKNSKNAKIISDNQVFFIGNSAGFNAKVYDFLKKSKFDELKKIKKN